MLNYQRLKLFLISLIFAYILVIPINKFVFKTSEVFPVFTWSLFSRTPSSSKQDMALFIHEVDGKSINPAVDFMLSEQFNTHTNDIRVYRIIQNLGQALHKGLSHQETAKRQLLETNLFQGFQTSIRYQLGVRFYRPIDRIKSGAYEFTPLKEYLLLKENP